MMTHQCFQCEHVGLITLQLMRFTFHDFRLVFSIVMEYD